MPRSCVKAQCARSPSNSGRGAITVFDFWRKTMTPKFRSLARSGLLALGGMGCLSIPAGSAPGGMAMGGGGGPGMNPIFIRHMYGGHSYYRGNWNNGWRYGNWNRGWYGNHWDHGWYGNHWNRGWYGGNFYRPYYHNYYGPSAALSFGNRLAGTTVGPAVIMGRPITTSRPTTRPATACQPRMCGGATTATGRTGPGTTPSSPTAGRASNAGRPIAEADALTRTAWYRRRPALGYLPALRSPQGERT
jgi:hypothetical protein